MPESKNKLVENAKYVLKAVSNIHRQGENSNIGLFSTPRSGSTWLLGLLAAQPRMKYYDEPCNIRREPVMRTGLFETWYDLMPESCDRQKIARYIDDLCRGRYGFMNPAPFRKNHSFFSNRVVFKIHELEHMIAWLSTECNLQTIYLIRHPIATTLSREVYPRLEYFLNSPYYMENLLSAEQARALRTFYDNGDNFERGIISWGFENLDILSGAQGDPTVMASYEELVLDPAPLLNHITDRLQLPDGGKMLDKIEKPSTNIYKSGQSTKKIMSELTGTDRSRKLVTKWRAEISGDVEKKCFDVLAVFGNGAYEAGRFLPTRQFLHRPELDHWNG